MCLFKKKKNTTPSLTLGTDGDFVDLGLSIRWASRNIGSLNEDTIGDYFNYDEMERMVKRSLCIVSKT